MDAHVGHLRSSVYRAIQDYLHPGYAKEKAVLRRHYDAHRARQAGGTRPRVLELACGLGPLASAFPAEAYLGIDASPARVSAARAEHPDRTFEVVDVTGARIDDLIASADFVFCHGLLHHLGDADCRALIGRVLRLARKPATFMAMEPLAPDKPLLNPLAWLIAKLDEGHSVRRADGYRALFAGLPLEVERYSLMPRYPLGMEAYVVSAR